MKKILLHLAYWSLIITLTASQTQCSRQQTQETKEWLNNFKKAASEGVPYYSQQSHYDPRSTGTLTSKYTDKTDVDLLVYGLDFYYASGTWFNDSFKEKNRGNLISIVKEAWEENGAIPIFSWHLENPYAPSSYKNYMGCRYRYGEEGYPEEHRYVIKEILEGTGDRCGTGRYYRNESPDGYDNPAAWFDARCREVADIIRELKDDSGTPIPIVLRLWHECEDSWQWWGSKFTDPEDYVKFFQLTVYKIEQYTQTNNIIYAYSPDRYWKDEEEFMLRYPGDEFVDIIGYDDYLIRNEGRTEDAINKARIVSSVALKHGKVAALFETSNNRESTSDVFFSEYLKPVIEAEGVYFGIVQNWESDTFGAEKTIEDRTSFLNSGVVKTQNNTKKTNNFSRIRSTYSY